MRVLMTTDTIGGVWTFTKELAAGLLQSGHAVALLSLGRLPSKEQQAWCSHIERQHGDEFVYESSGAPLEWMQDNEGAYADAESALLRLIDSFAPDLLHANQFCFGSLPVNLPKVITAHSDVLSWAAACRPDGLEASSWLERYKIMVESGLEGAAAVVAPTRWMLDALAENFLLHSPRYVIPNGRSVSGASENHSRSLQAVSVGRLWDEAKNLALLREVESPFPIFAVGEHRYGNAAASADSEHVHLAGPLTEEDLLRLYRHSSIYLAASIYEPFGLAPLEAALCGCAVVANDIPSLREVWRGGAVYFRGAAELSQILGTLRTSPNTLLAARQRSYQRGLQLSADRMTQAYIALYKDLLLSSRQLRIQELTALAC